MKDILSRFRPNGYMSGEIINRISQFLKLIRFKNLLFLLFLQSSIFYLLLSSSNISASHVWYGIIGLVIPTFLIAAFGNSVNDYFDYESDIINHKNASHSERFAAEKIKKASVRLGSLSLVSMAVSFLITNNLILLVFFISSILLLYYYSLKMKCIPILGNLVVSCLCVIALFLPIVYIMLIAEGVKLTGETRVFLSGFLFFVFLTTLIRELIKDLEDINGDRATGCKTLPVSIGESKTRNVLLGICLITALMLMSWAQYLGIFVNAYVMLFCVFPMILIGALIVRTSNYGKVSKYLKWLMFSSSLLIYIFHFSYNL